MREFYVAVRNEDCEPHYFTRCNNAFQYVFHNIEVPGLKCEMSANGDICYSTDEGWVEICKFDDNYDFI